jgi:hypothetical protein
VTSQITGKQRAISISLDDVRMSASQLQAGDTVDIYISLGASGGAAEWKLFRPDVTVLAVPSQTGPSGGGNLVLRMDTKDAANFAFAATNTQLYFVLRPTAGASPTAPSTGTAATVLR